MTEKGYQQSRVRNKHKKYVPTSRWATSNGGGKIGRYEGISSGFKSSNVTTYVLHDKFVVRRNVTGPMNHHHDMVKAKVFTK